MNDCQRTKKALEGDRLNRAGSGVNDSVGRAAISISQLPQPNRGPDWVWIMPVQPPDRLISSPDFRDVFLVILAFLQGLWTNEPLSQRRNRSCRRRNPGILSLDDTGESVGATLQTR